jgi:hypothetical protein
METLALKKKPLKSAVIVRRRGKVGVPKDETLDPHDRSIRTSSFAKERKKRRFIAKRF